MNKNDLLKAIKKARDSKKRNFEQSFDLIISFKNLDLKKADNQVEVFVKLPHSIGKEQKVCCFLGTELMSQKDACDTVIEIAGIDQYNKKEIKKISKEHDFYVAQGNSMAQVAKVFGKYLGPRNKMPNPKAGCVVGPGADLKSLKDNLSTTVQVSVKAIPLFQCRIGNEESKDEELVDNIMAIYNSLIHDLPRDAQNVKCVFVKLTMGSAIKVGGKEASEVEKEDKKNEEPKDSIKEASEKKEIKKEKEVEAEA